LAQSTTLERPVQTPASLVLPVRAITPEALPINHPPKTGPIKVVPVAGKPVPPFQPFDLTFSIDTMYAAVLKSTFYDDQDLITATVVVNQGVPQQVAQKHPNVGVGQHNIGLQLPTVHLASPDDKVVFNYLIVNSGGTRDTALEPILNAAGSTLAKLGITAAVTAAGALVGATVGTVVFPIVGSIVGAVAGFFISEGVAALFAQCDGQVAAEQVGFTAQYLWNQTHIGVNHDANYPVGSLTQHPGLPPATGGCQQSYYEVHWSGTRS
jgi:hypothetical protein